MQLSMTPQEHAEVKKLLASLIWSALKGPQTQALRSEADITLYGGAAGGGKSDLLLGAAATRHHRSILFRRQGTQLVALIERSREIIGNRGKYNGKDDLWRLKNGRVIEFGSVKDEDDKVKYQGRPHDLIGFDEIPHFTESQFRFLMGWLRTTVKGQRCRVIAVGNPPTDAEGDWVIRFWAPWLDPQHPNPAKPGELRWFVTAKGVDLEVESGAPYTLESGETVDPKSRTFIPARVEDNPYLMATGYASTLEALPEPLRSMMRHGSFAASMDDHPWQVIPTAWILAAQKRWQDREKPGPSIAMDALGVDVARGGKDRTILSARFGTWFAELKAFPGSSTPDGPVVVQYVIDEKGSHAPVVNVDVIGVGASVVDSGKLVGLNMQGLNASERNPEARDKSGQLAFVNCRAEWHWKLREALDPVSGEDLALPPDRELLADLTAPRWSLKASGIQIESKDEIKKRIGRSPDKGDALVYAHARKFIAGMGMYEYMQQQMAAAAKAANEG